MRGKERASRSAAAPRGAAFSHALPWPAPPLSPVPTRLAQSARYPRRAEGKAWAAWGGVEERGGGGERERGSLGKQARVTVGTFHLRRVIKILVPRRVGISVNNYRNIIITNANTNANTNHKKHPR